MDNESTLCAFVVFIFFVVFVICLMQRKRAHKQIEEMTRKDFELLPHRGWGEDVEFDSLIIIPGRARDMHDSGYRCMDFVAVKDNKPICLLSGCSDVIHVEGIGGFGKDWLTKYNGCPERVPCRSWNIDCLPKSGLLRIFCSYHKLTCGCAVGSFEIFSMERSE